MKKLFLLLLLLLLSFIPISVNAYFANTATDEDENYWRELVKDKMNEASDLKTASNILLRSFDNEIVETSKFIESAEFKFDQLKLRLLTERFSPYSFRATTKESCLVIEEFIQQYAEANKLLSIISSYVETFEQIKASIEVLLKKKVPLDVKVPLNSMHSDIVCICDHIEKTQQKLKFEVVTLNKIIGLLGDSLPKFKYIVRKHVIECYFVPSMIMYYPDAWQLVGTIYKDFFHALCKNLAQGIPDFRNEWIILVSIFSCGLMAFLIGWFLLRKFLKYETARCKMLIRSLFWGIACAVVFIYSELIDFYPRIHFNYFITTIFFVISIMYLSWGLRCKKEAPAGKSPFEPMLWLFIYGMILQFMDVYYPVLSLLWLFGSVTTIFYLKKQISGNYRIFEKHLLTSSCVLYIVCVLMVVMGLANLSILTALSWFIICLIVQLGLNVNSSARRVIEYFAGGSHSVLKIIIIGIIAPIVWLIMITFLYLWLVGQTFGSKLLIADLTSINIYGRNLQLNYIIFGVYLFFVFRAISNMTKITVRKLASTSKIAVGVAPSITLLVTYSIWSFYAIIILYLVGMNLTSLAVVTGGLGVGLGFGLRDIVNNFFSGLVILLSRSVKHGDIIEKDGILGKVQDITIRSTVIETVNNAIVAIPNAEILSSNLINWTGNNLIVRKEVRIGVAYDSDIEKVKYILLEIARNNEHVLSDPLPLVVLDEFASSTLNFILYIWVDDVRTASAIAGLIREKISVAFKNNGICMPYPQMELHLR